MTDTLDRPLLTREERARLRLEQYRRRRRIGWIVLATVLVLAGAGTYVVFGTSVLGVTEVGVSLTEPTGVDDAALVRDVEDAVGVPLGTPLITVDLDSAEQRVEALPTVADATVTRHWPGTLSVAVTPRVAVAVVAGNGQLHLVDPTGSPFRVVPAQPPGLLLLRLATPGVGDPATMAAIAVVDALPDEVRGFVASVSATSPYHVTLELADGRSVTWGSAARSPEKAQVLAAVLGLPGTSFDISDPEMPTVR